MLFGRPKDLVGLDIGDSSIKVVELKALGRGRGFEVQSLATEPLPQEAIVDGTIMDAALVVDALRRIWSQHKIKNRRVATALSGPSVIIRRINLPVMSDAELADQIRWEAEQYIPFDIKDVSLDYHVLEGSSLAGEGNMDVILVAVRKEKIDDYTSVIAQAGLIPQIVDVGTFAALGCFETNYQDEMPASAALIDIGASVTSIAILQHGVSVFWRDISIGGNQYTDNLQRELNLSRDQAEAAKRGETVEGVSGGQVQDILGSVNEELCHEIQRTVDFVKACAGSENPLEAIFLTGGGARLAGLNEALQSRFGARIEMLDPFRRLRLPAKVESESADVGPHVAVALGLALRKSGDRKINLLEKREPEKGAKSSSASSVGSVPSAAGGTLAAAAAGLIFLAGVGATGWNWYRLDSKIGGLNQEIADADQRIQELSRSLKAMDEFQAKKKALEHRVELISDLKRRQNVPVQLLDMVSRQVPDFLWLETLTERQGGISLTGKATTYNAVSNFYNNLKDSPFFADVTLGTTQKVTEGVSFALSCRFLPPKPGQDQAPAISPAAGPAPAPGTTEAPRG